MGHIPHKDIIDKFINNINIKEVELILLVGSCAVGNDNKYSDLDDKDFLLVYNNSLFSDIIFNK